MKRDGRGRAVRRIVAAILTGILIIGQSGHVLATSHVTMSREEITTIIEETARRKNIPPAILKAIAWKESRKTQFTAAGAPFVYAGNRGIMQINRIHTGFDADRILHDIPYNVESGADILLSKWLDPRTPVVGDRDPNVLEHWYFALWAYNGWLSRNNPNLHGTGTYQDGIYELIRTRYGQEVSTVDWHYIPATGLPPRDLHLPEPETTHEGGILFFQPEDRATADTHGDLYILDMPEGDPQFHVPAGTELLIISEAQLQNGLYWYEVRQPASGRQGWAAGIYLAPVFVQEEAGEDALWSLLMEPSLTDVTLDLMGALHHEIDENAAEQETEPLVADSQEPGTAVESERSLFADMQQHPAKEATNVLAELGVFSTGGGEFRPHQPVTRQEMALILHRFFRFGEDPLTPAAITERLSAYTDEALIGSWARESMALAADMRIVTGYPDGSIRPTDFTSREQGLVMIAKAMKERVYELDICASRYFDDGSEINEWALAAVNDLLGQGVFEGVGATSLNPQQSMTRVELAVVLYRLHLLGICDV